MEFSQIQLQKKNGTAPHHKLLEKDNFQQCDLWSEHSRILSFPTKLCNQLRMAGLECTLFSKHGTAHLNATLNKRATALPDMWGARGQVTSKLTSV